jgi:hypothetical protein
MTQRSVLLAVVAAMLVLALSQAPASAATRPAIIYPENGVKVAGHEARLSGKAAKLARYWIGKRLDTTCQHVSHALPSGESSEVQGATRFAGRVVRLGSTSGRDYCVVTHPQFDFEDEPVALVALTPAGAAWIEELQCAIDVSVLGPELDADGSASTPDAVVRANPELYVALPAPDAAPPSDKIGYWSDGVQHVVIAMTAPTSKRRLFLESEGDGVIRTNIFEYLGEIGLL